MEKAMTKRGRPIHVLAISFPQQGHVFPLLWLSKELALRGVTVTFLAYEDTIHQISSQEDVVNNIVVGKNLHFQILPKEERSPVEMAMHAVVQISEHMFMDFEPNLTNYIQDKNEGRDLPTCIVSDMFLMWTQDVADQLEIPRYMMIPSGATLALLIGDFKRLHEAGEFEIGKDGKLVKNDKGYNVPGLPHLFYHECPSTSLNKPAAFVERSALTWKSSGVLINTYIDLEDQIINSFNKLRPPQPYNAEKKAPKLYPVGPMRSTTPDIVLSTSEDQAQQTTPNECLAWLSSQPHSSVLYVAFGTVVNPSPHNICELALALEASQQCFLWVMRGFTSDALPNGFEARVSERGFVVRGWAPQVEILAHPATAAFLTHCGWNSCLESVLMGVPMIGWPGGAEQHLNCRDLMDRMKILEQIQTGPENVLRWTEAVRAIQLVMVEEEGVLIKERVKQLQKLLIEATSNGGSRSKEVQSFVNDLQELP